MKKKLFGILICTALLFSVNLTVYAQDTATQQEGTSQLPIGEEQDPNRPEEEVDNEENQVNITEEEKNQAFINGIIAGGIIGVVAGGVVAWLLKDKFYK